MVDVIYKVFKLLVSTNRLYYYIILSYTCYICIFICNVRR